MRLEVGGQWRRVHGVQLLGWVESFELALLGLAVWGLCLLLL